MEHFEIAWTAPEFEYRHKEVGWYWTSIITALIIMAAAIFMRNFLFAIFIVMAELLLIIWGNRQPIQIPISFTEKELLVGLNRKAYEIKDIASFSVDENSWSDWQQIVILFNNKFRTNLKILVPAGRLKEIRSVLHQLTNEVPHEETILETLEKFLGF